MLIRVKKGACTSQPVTGEDASTSCKLCKSQAGTLIIALGDGPRGESGGWVSWESWDQPWSMLFDQVWIYRVGEGAGGGLDLSRSLSFSLPTRRGSSVCLNGSIHQVDT